MRPRFAVSLVLLADDRGALEAGLRQALRRLGRDHGVRVAQLDVAPITPGPSAAPSTSDETPTPITVDNARSSTP